MKFRLIHKPAGEQIETNEESIYLPGLGDLYTPASGPQVKIVQRSFQGDSMPVLHGMKALQESDNAT